MRVVSFGAKVVAAISIINLVEDARWIQLQENLSAWLNAYNSLVSQGFGFLTGWINAPGFTINSLEQHLIVLFTLVTVAMVQGIGGLPRHRILRGMTPWARAREEAPKQGFVHKILLPMYATLLYWLFYTLVFGTFSPIWATIVNAITGGGFLAEHIYFGTQKEERYRRLHAVGQELIAVITLALMLVIANYLALQFT